MTGLRLPLVTDFENIIIFISHTESFAKLQPSATRENKCQCSLCFCVSCSKFPHGVRIRVAL